MPYVVYSAVSGKVFKGICEETPDKALKKLFKIIGTDAYKWRWHTKTIKQSEYDKLMQEDK